MSLPALDTVSFDARLPMALNAANPATSARALLETRLALMVLTAAPDDVAPAPALARLEAKFDLMLEILLAERAPQHTRLLPCRVGLEAIAWQDQQAYSVGSQLLLTLQPQAASALCLHLPLTVRQCQSDGDTQQLLADWRGQLDEASQLAWERWVFRQHRQQIGKRG